MRGVVGSLALLVGACSLLTNLGDLGGGGGSSVCKGAHMLCENFDNGAWASGFKMQSQSATVTIETDDFVSPPASLRVSATASDARGVLLGAFPSPAPLDFTCSISVRVVGFPAGYESRVAPIIVYDNTNPSLDYEIAFFGYGQSASLDEYAEMGDAAPSEKKQSLPITVEDGQWHRVTVTVHLGASPSPNVIMQIDSPAFSATSSLTPPSTITGVAFALGLQYAGSSNGWVAHFDDAVCDAL